MKYRTEEEFLKNYDSSEFEKLSMTTDILMISVSDEEVENYRKTSKKKMSVLLVKREDYPDKGKWCLPGGFLDPLTETLEACAKRVLERETNLKDVYLEQLYTFDAIDRDPRMRIVSTAFMALVDKNKLSRPLNKNASWFDITILEGQNELDVILENGTTTLHLRLKRILKDLTTFNYTYQELENKDLAFDHATVMILGLERLKNKLEYTDIVFNMMPEYFTLGELQRVYEVILGKKLLDPAFRRIIANKVEKTTKVKTGEGHRPSAMFRYKRSTPPK